MQLHKLLLWDMVSMEDREIALLFCMLRDSTPRVCDVHEATPLKMITSLRALSIEQI